MATSVNPTPNQNTPTNSSGPVGTGQPQAWSGAPVGTQVPTVSVNANGLLELPYDQQLSSGMLGAVDTANSELLGLKQQEDQQALQYQSDIRNTDKAYDTQRLTTKNVNAAGGTLFSSRYGTGVVNDATNYANTRGAIEANNASFQSNINLQRSTIQSALNKQLGAMVQEYTDKLSADAGNLGYGQSKQTPANHTVNSLQKQAKAAQNSAQHAAAKLRELQAIYSKNKTPASKRAVENQRKIYQKYRDQFRSASQKVKDYGG